MAKEEAEGKSKIIELKTFEHEVALANEKQLRVDSETIINKMKDDLTQKLTSNTETIHQL